MAAVGLILIAGYGCTSTAATKPPSTTTTSVVVSSTATVTPTVAVTVPPATTRTTVTVPQTEAPTAPAVTAAGGPPAGALAMCNDGTYSFAANHQGACSHHGGVKVFYR
jgi:hypothetical protein